MAKATIKLVYDKKTGRHELVVDLEDTDALARLDVRRHDALHDELVRGLVGDKARIVTAGGEGGREEAPAETRRPAGSVPQES